jgi:hypothetical protein
MAELPVVFFFYHCQVDCKRSVKEWMLFTPKLSNDASRSRYNVIEDIGGVVFVIESLEYRPFYLYVSSKELWLVSHL